MNNEHLAKLAKILKDFCDGKLELEPADRQDLILCLWELELIVGEDIPPEISTSGEDFLNLGIPPNIGKLSSENLVILEELLGKIKLKKTGKKETNEDNEEDIPMRLIPYKIIDGIILNQCYDPANDSTYFYAWDGSEYQKLEHYTSSDGILYFPNEIERNPRGNKPIIVMASEPKDYVSFEHLLDRIKSFIKKYGDISETDLQFFAYYCIFTWVYDNADVTPYLRFLADTGKGKTRMLKIVNALSFFGFMAAGCSTMSGAMRMHSKWQGTVLFNESDFNAKDDTSTFTKWVNNGFEKDLPIIMSNKENPAERDIFDTFGPKAFTMKRPFEDPATEGRLISIQMYETKRKDIPILLSQEFYNESLEIRNMLLDFRVKNLPKLSTPEFASDVIQLDVEPRMKQIFLPLYPVIALNGEKSIEEFKDYLKKRQIEVRKQRAQSWQGNVFNILFSIATNAEEYEGEFEKYRDKDGKIIGITSKMIADQMKISAKAITGTLKEIGFDIKQKRVKFTIKEGNDEKETVKNGRFVLVNSLRVWKEATSRYFIEYESGDVTVPECLKALDFISDVSDVTVVTGQANKKDKGISEEKDKKSCCPDTSETNETTDTGKKVLAVIEFLVNDRKEAEQGEIKKICSEDYGFSSEITIATISELLSRKRIFEARSYQNDGGQTIKIYNIVK